MSINMKDEKKNTLESDSSKPPSKPPLFTKGRLYLVLFLILSNALLAFISQIIIGENIALSIGYGVGYSCLFPLVHVAIASFWESKRNRDVRLNIFFWWSLLTLATNIQRFWPF